MRKDVVVDGLPPRLCVLFLGDDPFGDEFSGMSLSFAEGIVPLK